MYKLRWFFFFFKEKSKTEGLMPDLLVSKKKEIFNTKREMKHILSVKSPSSSVAACIKKIWSIMLQWNAANVHVATSSSWKMLRWCHLFFWSFLFQGLEHELFVTRPRSDSERLQHEVSHTPRTRWRRRPFTGWLSMKEALCWHTLCHLCSNCPVQIAHGLALVRSQTLGLVLFLKKWKLTVIVEAWVSSFHHVSLSSPLHWS